MTTRKEDFPGEKSIRGTYDSLRTVLHTPGLLEDVALATKGEEVESDTSRAAASLFGIVTEAESSPTRFLGADKVFRSVAHGVNDAEDWNRAFSGDSPAFAMAAKGGAQAYHQALRGERDLTQEQLEAAANMSDSSDEEESSDEED